MANAMLFQKEDLKQKAPKQILDHYKLIKKMAVNEVLAVFVSPSLPLGNNHIMVMPNLACYHKVTGMHSTDTFFDFDKIEKLDLTLENGNVCIRIVSIDKSTHILNVIAAREETEKLLKVMTGCLGTSGKFSETVSNPAENGNRCKSCGAIVDIRPGSSRICEYCGTKLE